MARIYVCDLCGAKFGIWTTTTVELPAPKFFDSKINVELCDSCIDSARKFFKRFMENK